MKTVSIPEEDPDLAVGVPPHRRRLAAHYCQARTAELATGEWDAVVDGIDHGGVGLLILSGVLCRRVGHREFHGAELLGPGDLLRPWDQAAAWSSIPTETSWNVIERARLAVLDAEFGARASRFPQIGSQLIGRALLRSRYLAILSAIVSQRRVDTRLTMLFWHLADRFGQVRGDAVEIPIPLTHGVLGELVAARRPTVTTALSGLQEQGVLLRAGRGWRLRGTAPPALLRDGTRGSGGNGAAPTSRR